MTNEETELLAEIEKSEGIESQEKTKAGKLIDGVISIVRLLGGAKILDHIAGRVLITNARLSRMERKLDNILAELKSRD